MHDQPHESESTTPTAHDPSAETHQSAVSAETPLEANESTAIASEHQVRVRRTPRYGRFMVLGAAVFAVASFIATYSIPQGEGYDRNTVFGFMLLASIAVGVGLGAIAAIVASAATKHTERTVLADRIDVQKEPADEGDDQQTLDLGELPAEREDGDGADRKAD
ncbi:hypothetical protein GCM10028798_32130 [Humibacter antri]